MQAGLGLAHLFVGQYDVAWARAENALRDLPTFLLAVAVLAASHGLAGREIEARVAMEDLRRLDPTLRLSNLTKWLPIHRAENLAVFVDGLRRAGLPE